MAKPDDLIIHVTADSLHRDHITGYNLPPNIVEVYGHLAAIREEIAAVRDGLDAWAGRIQKLEELVQEIDKRTNPALIRKATGARRL